MESCTSSSRGGGSGRVEGLDGLNFSAATAGPVIVSAGGGGGGGDGGNVGEVL